MIGSFKQPHHLSKKRTKMKEKTEQNAVEIPLGILLSEECPKAEISMALPTSAWWTGGPESQVPDADT